MEDRLNRYTPPSLTTPGWMEVSMDLEPKAKKAAEPAGIAKACDSMACKPLAMAFINKQDWDETYEPGVGFERGTIFPCLDLPFAGEGACRYE